MLKILLNLTNNMTQNKTLYRAIHITNNKMKDLLFMACNNNSDIIKETRKLLEEVLTDENDYSVSYHTFETFQQLQKYFWRVICHNEYANKLSEIQVNSNTRKSNKKSVTFIF